MRKLQLHAPLLAKLPGPCQSRRTVAMAVIVVGAMAMAVIVAGAVVAAGTEVEVVVAETTEAEEIFITRMPHLLQPLWLR